MCTAIPAAEGVQRCAHVSSNMSSDGCTDACACARMHPRMSSAEVTCWRTGAHSGHPLVNTFLRVTRPPEGSCCHGYTRILGLSPKVLSMYAHVCIRPSNMLTCRCECTHTCMRACMHVCALATPVRRGVAYTSGTLELNPRIRPVPRIQL